MCVFLVTLYTVMNKRRRMDMHKAMALANRLDDDTRREVFSYIPSLAQVMEPIVHRHYREQWLFLTDFQIHQYSFGDGLLEFRVTGTVDRRVNRCGLDDDCACDGLTDDPCTWVMEEANDSFAVGTQERLLSLPMIWPSMQRETVFPEPSGFYEGLWWAKVIGGQRL